MDNEHKQKSAAYGLHLLKCAVLQTLYEECELGRRLYLSTRDIRVHLELQDPAVSANLVRGTLEYLKADRYVEEAFFEQGTWHLTKKGVKFIKGKKEEQKSLG